MSAPSETTGIWDFALAFYAQPGVEADCLIAQGQYGLDVTALIFALYRAKTAVGFDAGQAAELARSLSSRVVEPLRAARIALKSIPEPVNQAAAEALRQTVKGVELEAERLTLEALSGLPKIGAPLNHHGALLAIVEASYAQSDEDLAALLKRLALSAQNV